MTTGENKDKMHVLEKYQCPHPKATQDVNFVSVFQRSLRVVNFSKIRIERNKTKKECVSPASGREVHEKKTKKGEEDRKQNKTRAIVVRKQMKLVACYFSSGFDVPCVVILKKNKENRGIFDSCVFDSSYIPCSYQRIMPCG